MTNINKHRIFFNATMSIVQIIVIGVVLFLLYKFLLDTLGSQQLGIWSLLLATTGITQIATLGLSGSAVKFVAKYHAHGDNATISGIIQTAAISVGIFVGIILIISYPLLKLLLYVVVPKSYFLMAFSILPFTLLSLWLMIITSIFQAGLDGYQRIDLRSFLLMSGSGLQLFLCYILAPRYGLIGLAYGSIIQNIVMMVFSWVLLKRLIPELPFLPYTWNKKLFREIVTYGIKFQIISILSICYDPITKIFLSKFGGLSLVGYYEMANKMIQQFRALLVSAGQVIVPVIANLQETMPKEIKTTYLASYQLLFYLALPLYALIIVCIPLISEIWIGYYESIFVSFAILLAIGWFLNTLNVPAFFVNFGSGELHWNLIGQLTIAFLNIIFGFLLGLFYGGIGVVVAWVISLALGSSIVYLSYHIRYKIPLVELLPKTSRKIMLACLVGILSTLIIHTTFNHRLSPIRLNSATIFLFLAIVFFPFWFHPMRKNITVLINSELLQRK